MNICLKTTPEQRAALRKMGKDSTPGPFSSVDGTIFCQFLDPVRGCGVFILYDRNGYSGPECNQDKDGKYFAAAVNALPDVLDDVETLLLKIKALEDRE